MERLDQNLSEVQQLHHRLTELWAFSTGFTGAPPFFLSRTAAPPPAGHWSPPPHNYIQFSDQINELKGPIRRQHHSVCGGGGVVSTEGV